MRFCQLFYLSSIVLWLLSPPSWAQNAEPELAPVIVVSSYFPRQRLDIFLQHHKLERSQLSEVKHYVGPGMFRETAELILLHQALRLGGIQAPIELVTLDFSGPQRYLQMLSEGRAAIMGESLWASDIDTAGNRVIATTAIVAEGNFLVGIYTHPDNLQALNSQTLKDLQQLTFVSNRNWNIDWSTLERIGVERIYATNLYKNMLHMVRAGRADAILSSFPPDADLERSGDGQGLVPIRNVRIALAGSRHFAVSMSYPGGEHIYSALEKGLTLLRARGKIKQAYRESGFYHPATRDWPVLNRELNKKVND